MPKGNPFTAPSDLSDPFDGQRVADNINRGVEQRKAKADRWALNRAHYFNDPPPRDDAWDDGDGSAADNHFNLVQVFMDGLATWIIGTVTSVEPYCVPSPVGAPSDDPEGVVETVQNAVFKRMKDAGLRDALRRVAQPTGWANTGTIWPQWQDGKGLVLNVVDPTRISVYPSCRSLDDCLVYAYSFDRTRGEVRALVNKKYYLEGVPGDDARQIVDSLPSSGGQPSKQVEDHPGQTDVTPEQAAVFFDDDLVELWQAVVRDPDTGDVRIMTVQADTGQKLKEDAYPYKTRCAFVFRYKPECTDEFYTEGSVAQDLQSAQELCNRALNLWDDGLHMATMGAAFAGPGSTGTASKVVKYRPGTLTTGVGLDSVNVFAPKVDVGSCEPVIDYFRNYASNIVRLSALRTGAPLKQGTSTAFEVQKATQGDDTGIEDYVDNFCADVPLLFAHVQELVASHDQEAASDPALRSALSQRFDWNVQVVSPGQTPRAQMQALMGLVPIAQDPGYRLDKGKIAERLLEAAERAGVTGAKELLLPADPVAQASQATGIDPRFVGPALQQAGMAQRQAMAAQQNARRLPQVQAPGGQGVPQPPGGQVLQVLGGGAGPGPTQGVGG